MERNNPDTDNGGGAPRIPGGRFPALAIAAVLAALIIGVAVAKGGMIGSFIERHFVFFPTGPPTLLPDQWGMEFEDVRFTTADGISLHGWIIGASGDAPMVLWFHGNAGNIGDRIENARLLHDRGMSLFMVDYRGYGRSTGAPTEEGIRLDGQAAYDFLIGRGVSPGKLIVFGRSLGCSVAADVASKNECAGVILETAFTNMADVARAHFPFLPRMKSFKHKFSTLDRISSVTVPILFIHGDADELVPYKQGRQLFEAATAEKDFYTIRGAHHNDTYIVGGKDYFDTFERFVRARTSEKESLES